MRLLTFNSHEAYIYDLARLGWPMDVVIDLEGHHHKAWDERMRPLPANIRLCTLQQLSPDAYDCVIAHNITDLLATKTLRAARVLTLHSSLHGRLSQEGAEVEASDVSDAIGDYLKRIGGQAVIISEMKHASWGIDAEVIPGAVDEKDYDGYHGSIQSGLRVANHIELKRRYLAWDLHEKVFADLPCRLVGVNPEIPDANPASSWNELKDFYRSHRFIVHTAAQGLEDGYNLALLEAMATGMPVITNDVSSSPVVHGESGFRSDDPEVLRDGVRRLLESPELARDMGAQARSTALRDFDMPTFIRRWRELIEATVRGRA